MRQHKGWGSAAVLSTLVLAATACGVSGYNSKCSGGICSFAFNGAQTLQLDFIRHGSKLELKDFGDRQMKVAAKGRETTVRVGKRATFGGFLLDLEKLEGDKGTLLIRSARR